MWRTVAEKEAKKGGDGKSAEVEALLGTLRIAKEAALFHDGTVASHLEWRTGAMEKAVVPAPAWHCLISWGKVRGYLLTLD